MSAAIGMHAASGRAISGIEHLQQSIADILTTPIGSRVMRRDYGSLVPELIDHPQHGATIVRLYAATATALMRWEPRIKLASVQLEQSQAGTAILILNGTAAGQNLELAVPIGGGAAP